MPDRTVARTLVRTAVCTLVCTAVALAQSIPPQEPPPPPKTAAISGIVIDGATGLPVSGAVVYISGPFAQLLGPQTRQLSDDRGRFAFVNLPGESTFMLQASKFGYIDGGYGRDVQPTDPLRPIQLKPDEWAANLKVQIWKPAVIGGVVRDESGEPVVGIIVRVLKKIRLAGRDELAAGPMTLTDDRGEYRIPGLPPGRYLVQVPSVQASVPAATKFPGTTASDAIDLDDTHRIVISRYPLPPPPRDGRRFAYPLIFHPSTSVVSEAEVIDLKYGEERTGLDVTLRPTVSVRVSGVVEGPVEALASLTLRLLPAGLENVGLGSEAATALVGADGRFTFYNVPAGHYLIDAPVRVSELSTSSFAGNLGGGQPQFPMPPPAQGWNRNSDNIELVSGLTYTTTGYRGGTPAEYSGRATVTVGNTDMAGVVVRLRPHATMSGRVVVEMDPAKPTAKPPAFVSLTLDPAGAEAYLGRPQRSGLNQGPGNSGDSFTITGIVPGQYWLRPQTPGFLVKSVSFRGRDYTNIPFDAATSEDLSGVTVTLTNAVPELVGTVRGSDDLKADATMAIAFPVDPNQWRNTGFWPARLKTTAVSSTGVYRFTTLPAGDYYVAAISRNQASIWRDAAVLTQLARTAPRVTLIWGGRASVDVNVTVIK